jgi:DNA ligase D-like protein (predicted 3'-phosphoesterase)
MVGNACFVVQRHESRTTHYDFRSEISGVFKSWAIPKGLPSEVGERRLAIITADHELSFGEFAGRVPYGEYGAGTITIWDQGCCTYGSPAADFARADLRFGPPTRRSSYSSAKDQCDPTTTARVRQRLPLRSSQPPE